MNAADIMTPDPVSIRPNAPLEDAVRIMLEQHVSGVPVVDEHNRPVGMLTESDLLERMETGTERRAGWLSLLLNPGRAAQAYVRSHGRRVRELMTPEVISVTETTPLDDVVALMRRKRIKRVPVIRDEALVGIVSRADLVRALARLLPRTAPAAMSDEEIRAEVEAELARQPWAPKFIRVDVAEGEVDLDGAIFDERDRAAIRVAAENVPGVKAVHDHMVWVDPNSAMTYSPDGEKTGGM